MRFVFSKTAMVEGQTFEAGVEVVEADLRPDLFESLRRVGVLVTAPVQQTLGFRKTEGDAPAEAESIAPESTPPAGEPGTEPKADKKAKKKPENK